MPRPLPLHSCDERLQAKEMQCKRVKRMEHTPKQGWECCRAAEKDMPHCNGRAPTHCDPSDKSERYRTAFHTRCTGEELQASMQNPTSTCTSRDQKKLTTSAAAEWFLVAIFAILREQDEISKQRQNVFSVHTTQNSRFDASMEPVTASLDSPFFWHQNHAIPAAQNRQEDGRLFCEVFGHARKLYHPCLS